MDFLVCAYDEPGSRHRVTASTQNAILKATLNLIRHKNGAKIHALGFTSLDGITQYHFDSVDSTAWTAGNRFGLVYHFDGRTMQKINVPKGYRIKDSKRLALMNYIEWVKFQKYADTHL